MIYLMTMISACCLRWIEFHRNLYLFKKVKKMFGLKIFINFSPKKQQKKLNCYKEYF